MKKMMLLTLLPFLAACNKTPDMNLATASCAETRSTPTPTGFTNAAMKTAGTPVTFSTTQNFGGYTSNGKEIYTGNFTSSGLFTGSGTTYEIVNVTFPGGGNGISTATFTFHSSQTFIFTDGSLTIHTNGSWGFTSSSTGAGSGSWTVSSGTGSYSDLKGSGTLEIPEILFNETGAYQISDIYTGSLQ
jgi:hypothetical protein